MILEHALLRVCAGETRRFEAAMAEARPLIAASPGFHGLEVRPASRDENLYLLIVHWSDIAAHEDGFRASDRYQQWRALLHGLYDPMPEITYFEDSIV